MAKPIYNELRQRFPRSKIKIFDPVVKSKQLKEFFNSEVSTDLESSFRDMTLFIIANNHPLFSSMPISNLSGLMKKPGIIFDFWNNFSSRNILFPEGINYLGLGELGLYLKENE